LAKIKLVSKFIGGWPVDLTAGWQPGTLINRMFVRRALTKFPNADD
jgi:hypothetical protein